jgi:DNA-binding response OmpR family regulator
VSRIRALLRRVHKGSPQFLQRGNTIIDSIRHTFSVNGKSETVPPKEFLVLRLLSQSPGRIYPKDEILNIVWRGEPSEETNVVEATITNLRRRLSQARSSLTVKNMRNAGYWLED